MSREYGPHDPATAPSTVTVLEVVAGVRVEREVPLTRRQLKQRRDLNSHAYDAGKVGAS